MPEPVKKTGVPLVNLLSFAGPDETEIETGSPDEAFGGFHGRIGAVGEVGVMRGV